MEHIRCHDGRTTLAASAHLTINYDSASCHVGFLFPTDCDGEGNLAQKQRSSKKPAGSLQAGCFSKYLSEVY